MLVILLQALILLIAIAILLRKPQQSAPDPRQLAIPDQIARMEATLQAHTERQLSQIRAELASEASTTRTSDAAAAAALRAEVLKTLELLDRRFTTFSSEAARTQLETQNTLHAKLADLASTNSTHQEKLRTSVETSLTNLTTSNEAKLDKMRETVDEKLQKTLETRLTASFGQVTTHLGEVQRGLGEMKLLATGVGDLKKVLTNVKTRGMVGEFQLGQQLEQMFAPEQYIKNARIKPSTTESVEYALKFPNGEGPTGYTLLPIDAKFPKEAWELLEHAYEHGSADDIADAGKAFERVIKAEADRICKKYIDPPVTLPHAVMFLPTENLYAEVVRRPGLQSGIQASCNVTVAGPSTFMAILTSFQMGFHSLAIQKKGDEVWRVLAKAKTEFSTFGTLMAKVEKQVGTVQNTLKDINSKTTTINRALKSVSNPEALPAPTPSVLAFEDYAGVAPLLAASTEPDEDEDPTPALFSNK